MKMSLEILCFCPALTVKSRHDRILRHREYRRHYSEKCLEGKLQSHTHVSMSTFTHLITAQIRKMLDINNAEESEYM